MAYKYHPPPATSVQTSRGDITAEFARWNDQAGEPVVTDYDLPLAKNSQREASVRFLLRGSTINIKIDRWDSFAQNLRCCYLNIRDMRLMEARGALESMREALLQLPGGKIERDPYEVLSMRPDASLDDIEAMYRVKARRVHPDTGGADADPAAFKALTDAIEKIRAQRSGR